MPDTASLETPDPAAHREATSRTKSKMPDKRRRSVLRAREARVLTRSLAAGEVHAAEQDRRSYHLVDPEALAEEHDARDDADEGDQVLVDEHPVRPDARDPTLPGGEPEGGHHERGVAE